VVRLPDPIAIGFVLLGVFIVFIGLTATLWSGSMRYKICHPERSEGSLNSRLSPFHMFASASRRRAFSLSLMIKKQTIKAWI